MRALVLPVFTLSLLATTACGGARRRAEAVADPRPCGDAEAVSLADATLARGVFTKLRGPLAAVLSPACAPGAACSLPEDRSLTVRVTPKRKVACAFAACRVPYFGSLPFEPTGESPCPSVLWTIADVSLASDRGTIVATAHDVSVLATRRGEAFVRFILESPASLQESLPVGAPRTTLLDVQLEAAPGRVRGQLSVLAADLPAQPASELRFGALWSATWESALAP